MKNAIVSLCACGSTGTSVSAAHLPWQLLVSELQAKESKFTFLSVPELFKNLSLRSHITTLSLPWCRLTELPDSLQQLLRLKELDVSYNALSDLPDYLTRLPLEALNTSSNPDLSQYLWTERDPQNVQNFLSDRSRASELWPVIKLVLIGEEGVGKTSLLNAMRHLPPTPPAPTLTVEISDWSPGRKARKTVEGKALADSGTIGRNTVRRRSFYPTVAIH